MPTLHLFSLLALPQRPENVIRRSPLSRCKLRLASIRNIIHIIVDIVETRLKWATIFTQRTLITASNGHIRRCELSRSIIDEVAWAKTIVSFKNVQQAEPVAYL
jgi:hypothetical protein